MDGFCILINVVFDTLSVCTEHIIVNQLACPGLNLAAMQGSTRAISSRERNELARRTRKPAVREKSAELTLRI